MSVTLVTVLAIVGICCIFMLTALLALLRVAARSDAQLERELQQSPRTLREQTAADFVPSGRFARRREARTESSDRPYVH